MTEKKNILIVGAGISGLSCAYHLKKLLKEKANITLLEKSARAGGWIQTSHDNSWLFEMGPRSFRTTGRGATTLALVEELNLKNELLIPSDKAKKRYLFLNKTLTPMPTNFISFFTNPHTRNLIPALVKEPFIKKSTQSDESIYDFFYRRFNKHTADVFADALVTGIFAGDPKKLSMRCCFPALWQAEQNSGSVICNMFKPRLQKNKNSDFVTSMQKFPMLTFKRGMQTLPDQLASNLKDLLQFSSEIEKIKIEQNQCLVTTKSGDSHKADAVVFSVPPYQLAKISKDAFPHLSQMAEKIECTTVVIVGMRWKKKVHQSEGFGYLIPHSEKEKILGVVFDSSAFPEHSETSEEQKISVMMGGARQIEIAALDDEEIFKIAWESVKKHLNINQLPDFKRIYRAKNAIAQYTLNHHLLVEKMQDAANKTPIPTALIGSYLKGVSINDCIYHAKNAADQIAEKLYND